MKQKDIREKILKEHGLISQQRAKGKQRRLVIQPPYIPIASKTTLMELLETRHKKPIQKLLLAGSLTVVAKNLGIDFTTVSKWKKRLGLNGEEAKE